MATASSIQLSPEHLGIVQQSLDSDASLDAADRFLQRNHEDHHMFWRDIAGHNHLAHSVLNVFALGGGPKDLQRAFDDSLDMQRPIPHIDEVTVSRLSNPEVFYEHMGNIDNYGVFLVFFKREIQAKGWISVVEEYCFGKDKVAENMFAQLFEGLYHPLIHLGLGIEFAQPSIVAEGLAQAASHNPMGTTPFFQSCEERAKEIGSTQKSLVSLLEAIRDNEVLRRAPHDPSLLDGTTRVEHGALGPEAQPHLVDIAAQFQVDPLEWQYRLAETINSSALSVGGYKKPGKARKVDFFHMHAVTASIALTVLTHQRWVPIATKVRLIEFKGRLDMVWYTAGGSVPLAKSDITEYVPELSAGYGWDELFQAVLKVHDDGHLAKLVRALRHGEQYSKAFLDQDPKAFPVQGGDWLKIAQMGYDTAAGREIEQKWIWGVGFDDLWVDVPAS